MKIEWEPLRCTVCGHEVIDEPAEPLRGCPKCGTKSVPCAIKDDVTIKINWHELRILGLWAMNWADHIQPDSLRDNQPDPRQAIISITSRLQAQFPDKTPLTLMGEIQKLKDTGLNISTHNINMDPGFDPTQEG